MFDEFTEVVAIASLLIPLQSAFEAVDYIGEEVNTVAGTKDEAVAVEAMKLYPLLNKEITPTLIVEVIQLTLNCFTAGQYLVFGVGHKHLPC